LKKVIFAAVVVLATGCASTGQDIHWGYFGEEGPDHWGTLCPEFIDCSRGKNQAPIDLTGFIDADLPPLDIRYRSGGNEVINKGHSVQVNVQPGSRISLEGHTFELKQYHFHFPSENRINGRSYPMEAQLVHADKKGNLAIIAVMFVEGKANPSLAMVWMQIPGKAGEKNRLLSPVSAADILPAGRAYYRFNGSLTTPPCTEGVWWIVMKEPVTVSEDQIERFARVMGYPNNRPVQPVNARPVLQ